MSAGRRHLPAWRVEVHPSLPSTQQLLKDRIAAGVAVHGQVVRALEQPAGVGRRGRSWAGCPGGSYQSVALADEGGRLRRSFTPLAVAIGVAEELRAAGAQARVKWPNDVYLGGGKLAGILSEYVRAHLVVGVGVNVENEAPIGAAALRGWELAAVHRLVLDGVRRGLSELVLPVGAPGAGEGGNSSLPGRLAPLDLLTGRWVVLLTPAGEVQGVARGVDPRGALLVETAHGTARVLDGSVLSWREAPPA